MKIEINITTKGRNITTTKALQQIADELNRMNADEILDALVDAWEIETESVRFTITLK